MKLTVLGSGNAISGPERAASGFALELGKEIIIIDLGFGCFKNMQKAGIDYSKVNNLFFTHFEHPDHINDLSAFLFARKGLVENSFSEKTQINIFAASGIKKFVENLFALYPLFENLPFKLNVEKLGAYTVKKFNGFTLTTKPMKHKPSSLGLKFKAGGKTIIFTGDTESNENLVELAKDADLLVSECTYATTEYEGHLNAKSAAKIASKANAKQLFLTHFHPGVEKADLKALAQKNFNGKIFVAKDLMQVTV